MADRELVVKFDGKDVGLAKAAKNAETAVEGVAKGVAKGSLSADALSGGLTSLAGALQGAVKAGADDAAQQAVLANQLKNVTGANAAQIAGVEKWINKVQNSTGVLDDELRPALQNLVVATKDTGQAQKLLGVALDISKAKGLDLTTVSAAMAKAHAGNVGALQKLGIATKDAAGNTLSFDQIMQNANATFGGATAAAVDTAAGKAAILSAKFSDIQETVGTALLPILTQLGTFVADTLVPAFFKVWEVLGKVGKFVVQNKEYFIALGIGIAAALVPALIAWAVSAASAAAATIAALAPVIAIAAAIAALAAGVIYAYKHWGWFRDAVNAVRDAGLWFYENVLKPIAAWIVDKLVPAVVAIVAKLVEWGGKAKEIATTIIEDIGKVLHFVESLPGKIKSATVGMWDGIKEAFRSAINWLIDAWNNLELKLPEVDTHIPGIGKVGGFGLSTPNIPRLAEGGIVTGPTIALIGEAGPEAVVPLSQMGGGNVININMPAGSNGADVVAAIQRYERVAGASWRR
jgi:hypothetical protein